MGYVDPKKITLNCSTLIDGDGDILVPLSEVRKAIAQTPTEEDVVKIVRCKDCEYNVLEQPKGIVHCHRGLVCQFRTPTDYCSFAERKENEK